MLELGGAAADARRAHRAREAPDRRAPVGRGGRRARARRRRRCPTSSRASATTGSAPRCSRCAGATAMPASCCSASTRSWATHAAEAMFHGARALSRADQDDEAIAWYHKVVATLPAHRVGRRRRSSCRGWLEFNRGNYKEAIAPLEDSLARYPQLEVGRRRAVVPRHVALLPRRVGRRAQASSTALAKLGGSLEGGKGMYWLARIDERLGDRATPRSPATRETVTTYPFSWYALLARSRLAALGIKRRRRSATATAPSRAAPSSPATVDESLASDDLIARADELIAAGPRRRCRPRARARRARVPQAPRSRAPRSRCCSIATARPATTTGRGCSPSATRGSALDGPPEGDARRWWENAYPRAYRDLVEKYQDARQQPRGLPLLDHAQGERLQPARPVVRRRAGPAADDPADHACASRRRSASRTTRASSTSPTYNIQTGSWYIGHLLAEVQGPDPARRGLVQQRPAPGDEVARSERRPRDRRARRARAVHADARVHEEGHRELRALPLPLRRTRSTSSR